MAEKSFSNNPMKLSDFDYSYPEELVAQHPLPTRDAARMMVVPRTGGAPAHHHVRDLPEFLYAGDVLVVNRSKVIPARLFGRKESGGGVEVVLLRQLHCPLTPTLSQRERGNRWWCLTSHTKRLKPGMRLHFPSPSGEGQGEGKAHLSATVGERVDDEVLFTFECTGNFEDTLHKIGLPPLPPYIVRKDASDYSDEDRIRYQTVFARDMGSAAAPTAGLHLSEEILAQLRAKGVLIAEVVLHVGRDTFQPVRVENIADHKMHGEEFTIPEETADIINRAKRDGRRVIAVGTTSARALESSCSEAGVCVPGTRTTHIFMTPGYRFRVIDGLMTNFHQPKSTLIMLVSALLGRERVLALYKDAIRNRYRLFSFGDCMVVL
jgi:S-adenosylmethionine:tRNA ribosyltransferase-isomerase